jgi:hypothetical protein
MKNILRSIAILLVSLFFYNSAKAQSFKQDIIAVTRNLTSLKTYSLVMKYYMFVDNKLKTPYESKEVVIKQDNENYLMLEPGKRELIDRKKDYLMIDHTSGNVIYNKLKGELGQDEKDVDAMVKMQVDFAVVSFDSLMSTNTKIKLVSDNYPVRVYELTYSSGEYKKVKYTIDVKQKIFRSIEVVYAEPEYIKGYDKDEHVVTLRVDYVDFKIAPVISKSDFDLGKYIEKSGGTKMKLKGNIKNYKLQVI